MLNGVDGNGYIPNDVLASLIMSELSYVHKNRKFKLRIEPTVDHLIKTVYTNPFIVV